MLLTGEISDELFGYKYTDFAPSAKAFQEEAQKRIRELHMYDVLRADRCISVNSLEARVPFGDLDFVKYVMAIDPEMKLNKYGKGKYLLRHAFEKGDYLPHDILLAGKGGVLRRRGSLHGATISRNMPKAVYTQEEFEEKRGKVYPCPAVYQRSPCFTGRFLRNTIPDRAQMIVDFWMPNRILGGLQCERPLRPRPRQLRRQREITGFPRLHGQTKVPIFAPQKRHISWK